MLTRIEIDGFKSFRNFSMDFKPFTYIVGSNGSGKSNLLSAISLLSCLASAENLSSAFIASSKLTSPLSLFNVDTESGKQAESMKMAAEVLLPVEVRDSYGQRSELNHTRVRYEIAIRTVWDKGLPKLVVEHESVAPILEDQDTWVHSTWITPSDQFRSAFQRYGRSAPWLEMTLAQDQSKFHLHPDGGEGYKTTAIFPTRSMLSTITDSERFTHLFALRQEMQGWKTLNPAPNVMRASRFDHHAPDFIGIDGQNLVNTISRILDDDPSEMLMGIRMTTGLSSVQVEQNALSPVRVQRGNAQISLDMLSDTELRTFALMVLVGDSSPPRLACLDSAFAGLDKSKAEQLMEVLKKMGGNSLSSNETEPLAFPRQIIVTNFAEGPVLGFYTHFQRIRGV